VSREVPIDELPPEDRREAVREKNRVKPAPTKEQIDLALQILELCKDYSKMTSLMSAASTTLQDALKR
jgi:hypothetical protein